MDRLIIVAGSGRNVGKTECACRLIETFSGETGIYGLKVSAIHPDEAIYHGGHDEPIPEDRLFEETRPGLDKDTARMLRAGARRVWYLQGDDDCLLRGFKRFRPLIPPGGAVVCESGSLWKVVRPGLLVLVTDGGRVKPRALELFERASLVIVSDRASGFPGLEKIGLSKERGWFLAAGQND